VSSISAELKQSTFLSRLVGRRSINAGVATKIGNHTFRANGIAAYLKNKGTLEHAQTIGNHASPRATKLYDRRDFARRGREDRNLTGAPRLFADG